MWLNRNHPSQIIIITPFILFLYSVLQGDNPSSTHYPRAMVIRIDYYPAGERILTLTLPSIEGQWVTLRSTQESQVRSAPHPKGHQRPETN